MSRPQVVRSGADPRPNSTNELNGRLLELANMVEALVRSLSDADVVTRADLYGRIKAIEAEKTKRG